MMKPACLDLAIVQTKPRKGTVASNRAMLLDAFSALEAEPPHLIVLPEAALTGYFLEGATYECALSRDEFADELTNAWRSISDAPVEIVCGFYENDGGTLYNSAIALAITVESSQILHVHRKLFLPTYGVFDEARFVSRGRNIGVYAGVAVKTAIAICEDAWHAVVPTIAAVKGARLLIVPSASPGRGPVDGEFESLRQWRELLAQAAREHGIFIVYAGLTGFEGGKGMTGGSCIVDPFGQTLVRAPIFDAAVVRARLDLREMEIARACLPLIGDLGEVLPDLLRDPQLLGNGTP
jgi:N-carbamoylputrescine amidase